MAVGSQACREKRRAAHGGEGVEGIAHRDADAARKRVRSYAWPLNVKREAGVV